MTFDAFRDNGQPTYFSAVHLPWEADLVVCGLCFCFLIIFLSFCPLVLGIAGKEKCLFIFRVFISLFIGATILTTNFSMTWETAETTVPAQYKAGTGQEINATIGVNIGLRGVNITLKADNHQLEGETIDYNERFSWAGLQGRQGFGPFAGTFNQEYRAAQFRGVPLPILWVAEYFTLDGEGIRWGRHYRQAGWYTHIMLWLSFPLWILANILFFVLLRYGAYLIFITGLSMVIANIIWNTYRNCLDLRIPFTESDALEFSYGASFWMCLGTGLLCMIVGTTVFIMDKCMPTEIAMFFGVDVLQDSEKIQEEYDSGRTMVDDKETYNNLAYDKGEEDSGEENDIYSAPDSLPRPHPHQGSIYSKPYKQMSIQIPSKTMRSFRTAEHRLTKSLQRPRRREPPSEYISLSTPLSTSAINMDTFRETISPSGESQHSTQ